MRCDSAGNIWTGRGRPAGWIAPFIAAGTHAQFLVPGATMGPAAKAPRVPRVPRAPAVAGAAPVPRARPGAPLPNGGWDTAHKIGVVQSLRGLITGMPIDAKAEARLNDAIAAYIETVRKEIQTLASSI